MSRTPVNALAAIFMVISVAGTCVAADVPRKLMVPMRDGVTIRTYVQTPRGNGPWCSREGTGS